ncbi:MAG: NAD(P)H-dependent glycerol-3-phosphate dehydrogenase [Planctomycetota bacterium]
MSRRITIIGDGAMGTTCALMLAEGGCSVRLWSAFADTAEQTDRLRENRRFLPGFKLPDAIEVTGEDEGVFDGADLAVSAVPTQFMRGVWRRLAEHCPPSLGICSVAKGIENSTLLRPTQIITDVLADSRPTAALSGPCIAPEVASRLPATVVVASQNRSFAEDLQVLFTRPYFRVYTNDDHVGVEAAGATKNVIAIAAGILDGMEAGCNAKAALLTRGVVEITRLGVALGGQAETFAGLAGVGDLVTTCFSPIGRNRSFGEAVGRGKTVQEALAATESVVEGVATTESVVELAGNCGVEMPITEAVHSVIFASRSPSEAIEDLMSRPLKAES